MIELSWNEFKKLLDLGLRYSSVLDISNNLIIHISDKSLVYRCIPVGSEITEYVNSYKSAESGSLEEPINHVKVEESPPFSAKKITVDGVEKSLFKRIHGVSSDIILPGGDTVNIDFVVPHAHCKFTGAEVMNTDIGDTLNYFILDTDNNDYSGAPGSNYELNQFGFNVQMSKTYYSNTSDYDADLYLGMIVRCQYTNNSDQAKIITSNLWLHEVKS